jgi:hypothetical protein
MGALQLVLIAWQGLQLLFGLVGVGVEVSRRPAAEVPAVVGADASAFVPVPDATWQFSILEPGESWMVRP